MDLKYDDQSSMFMNDGQELPTDLGFAIVKGMAEVYLDTTIKERFDIEFHAELLLCST